MSTEKMSDGQRLQQLRTSNAAGFIKDRRTKRNRDRSTRERKAREDQE